MLRKVVQQQWKREVEQQRKQYLSLGKQFSEPEFPEAERRIEEVEIEREVIVEMSCSDGEIAENDRFSRKSVNPSSLF